MKRANLRQYPGLKLFRERRAPRPVSRAEFNALVFQLRLLTHEVRNTAFRLEHFIARIFKRSLWQRLTGVI